MQKIIRTIRYYTDKRFSTIAGTLVYFLLMSITPFMFWLALSFGNVDMGRFLNHRLLEGVSPMLRYLKSSAEHAADENGRTIGGALSGTGIIFLATSLYSSTNFFYHLRRSGEIIYESKSVKGGFKLRFMSLLLIAAAIILIALVAAISVAGSAFLEMFLPAYLSDGLSLVFITVLMFSAAVVLNIFACPEKMKFKDAVCGSLLTTGLWLVFLVGFGVYLKFASPEKLYGKIASVIVFLLWCYIMTCCLVIGMINNGRYMKKSPNPSNPLYAKK